MDNAQKREPRYAVQLGAKRHAQIKVAVALRWAEGNRDMNIQRAVDEGLLRVMKEWGETNPQIAALLDT